MKRILKLNIADFEDFYAALKMHSLQNKVCYSVSKNREYETEFSSGFIIIKGEERKQDSKYSKETIQKVYQIVKGAPKITTTILAPAVGRHRSPILALMVASGVIEIIN